MKKAGILRGHETISYEVCVGVDRDGKDVVGE